MVTVACLCPPTRMGETRHPAGDEITLRERLDFRAALTARNTMAFVRSEDPDASVAEILAALTEIYLLVGIESWTIVDAHNAPVAASKAAIREILFAHPTIAMDVGNAADELYSEAVLGPLVALASMSSPPTPTNGSTSARKSSSKHPRPSKPSSITSTPTDGTETTSLSPDGVSSSSPN